MPDFSDLDDFLDATDTDGYLIDADSTDSDQYYLSGFDAPDPFVTLYDGEGRSPSRASRCRRGSRSAPPTGSGPAASP